MIINDYKEIKWISHRAMFKAMADAGESVNPDEAAHEMEILIRHAKKSASDYRDARAHFRHHKRMDNRNPHYKDLIEYMEKLESKYKYRSLPFQYMLEAVSCVTKTFKQIHTEYIKNPNPPAFDESRRSVYSINIEDSDKEDIEFAKEGKEIRREFFDWVLNTKDPVIKKVKEILENPRSYIDGNGNRRIRNKRYSLTRNGTTSGITFKGDKLLDIEGQCFKTKAMTEKSYPNISNYFGVSNFSEDDHHVYLEIDDKWDGCMVMHTMVPDKDGKSREVYFLLPAISAVGKGIAEALDKGMRLLPGIYTYDQRLWIEEALDREWNKLGMIITVDMEKFSDTIVRSYLMSLLIRLGIPVKVVREMDDLFSLPVWDIILNKSLGTHEVVLQGQYSIFMIMSLMNLCLQRYIIWKVDQQLMENLPFTISRLLSAVLGDDTALRFQSKDYNKAWKVIVKQYGSMGMTINQHKSDYIIDGKGQGDFAKTNFDRYGIIDHLNPKNVQNHNIDGIINDILWLHQDYEYKYSMLSSLFSSEIASEILDLSIINGGSSDHPITKEDISYFINNIQRFNINCRGLEDLDEERALSNIALEYRKYGFSLKDSPLVEYVPKEMRENLGRMNVDQQDDMIKVYVLNASVIGMTIDYASLKELEGKIPSELHQEYVNSKLYDYESHDADLWSNLRTYDQFAAKRKMEKHGRYSSIYLPCMNGAKQEMTLGFEQVFSSRIENIKDMNEYRELELIYRKDISARIMRAEGITLYGEWHWGHYDMYLGFNKGDKREIRRLYSAWNSKYLRLTKEEYDSYLRPSFRKHNMMLTFDEFMRTYGSSGW